MKVYSTYLEENSLEGTAEEPQKHWQSADTYCIDAGQAKVKSTLRKFSDSHA
jgi:hypothetical protein